MYRNLCSALPLLLAGWLVAVGTATAAAQPITDEAGCFSAEAVRKANEAALELSRSEKKELVLETFKGVPEEKVREVHGMPRKAREQFFVQWAEVRARERQVDGIYVLICRNPVATQVVLGAQTDDNVFPERDRAQLARRLAVRSAKQRYDTELLDVLTWTRSTMHANLHSPAPPDVSRVWLWLGSVIVGLLLLWCCITLVRVTLGYLGHHRPHDEVPAPITTPVPAPVEEVRHEATEEGELIRAEESGVNGPRSDLEQRAEEY